MDIIRKKEEDETWENEPLLTTFCSNYQDVEQEYRKYIPLKVGKRANKRKSLNTVSIVLMGILLGVSIMSLLYVGYLSFKEENIVALTLLMPNIIATFLIYYGLHKVKDLRESYDIKFNTKRHVKFLNDIIEFEDGRLERRYHHIDSDKTTDNFIEFKVNRDVKPVKVVERMYYTNDDMESVSENVRLKMIENNAKLDVMAEIEPKKTEKELASMLYYIIYTNHEEQRKEQRAENNKYYNQVYSDFFNKNTKQD